MQIPLTNSPLYAEIDDADYFSTFTIHHKKSGTSIQIRPCDVSWHIDKDGYAKAKKKASCIQYRCFMHALIMGKKPGLVVDHISQYKLDNRRSNLHFVTASQNSYNRKSFLGSSKYKGVCFPKSSNKFKAHISIQGHYKHLGYFSNEVEAALAYDTALKKVYPNAPPGAFNF